MKIGKLSYILSAFVAFSAFTACDSIDEDERYVLGDAVVAKRNVLIEDFTGQFCVNCPNAHEVIEALKAGENGESIIAVSIHAGSSAIPAPAGLKTKEGDEYANKWNITAYPKGIINRNPTVLDFKDWSAVVRTELEKETSVDMDLSATLSMDGTSVVIKTDLNPVKDINGKLQLWITESNIVALQQLPGGGYDGNYVHNHVFRSSVNGTWGEEISLSANVYDTKQHSIAVNEKWNAENLSVVAFVYNDSEGVLQIVETPVKSLQKIEQ